MKFIKHKNYTIKIRSDGFQQLTNIAGRVVSFWVVSKDKKTRSIFAFAHSLLNSFAYAEIPEKQIIEDAVSLIKEYIEEEKIADLEEHLFKYEKGQFIVEDDPEWWNKTLLRYLKRK